MGRYVPLSEIEKNGYEAETFTEQDLKHKLSHNVPVPDWFSYPDVIQELRAVYPSRSKQGFTLFFTGLSGSGKSTLARIIYAKLIEAGGRPVTLLDGDVVRLKLVE